MIQPVSVQEWLEAIKIAQPGSQRQAVMLDLVDRGDDSTTAPDINRYIVKMFPEDYKAMYEMAENDLGLLCTHICEQKDLEEIYRKAIDNVANK